MDASRSRFPLKPVCVALSALLPAGQACANEPIAAPLVVLPRMLTQQGALNATQGGQLTVITSNGVMQGPAASMLQMIAPHAVAGAAPSQTHTALIAGVLRHAQSGATISGASISAATISPPQVAGVGGSPAGVPASGNPPTGPMVDLSAMAAVGAVGAVGIPGTLPLNLSSSQPIIWQNFNIAGGLGLGGAVINLTGSATASPGVGIQVSGVGGSLGITSIVSNGQPLLPPSSGVTILSSVPRPGTGAITFTSAAGVGAAAVTTTGAKPVTPITVR